MGGGGAFHSGILIPPPFLLDRNDGWWCAGTVAVAVVVVDDGFNALRAPGLDSNASLLALLRGTGGGFTTCLFKFSF